MAKSADFFVATDRDEAPWQILGLGRKLRSQHFSEEFASVEKQMMHDLVGYRRKNTVGRFIPQRDHLLDRPGLLVI